MCPKSCLIKTVWCITLYVSDLARSKNFYEEILGLEKKYEFSSYVGFECGGVEIGLIPKAEEGKAIVDSSPSVEFLVSDIEQAYSELKGGGEICQRAARRTLGWKTGNFH